MNGPAYTDFQVGLTTEEMRALDAMTLEQLLAQLKRAHLQNRQPAKSGYRGVRQLSSGRWQARWKHNGTERSMIFDTGEEAARTYDRWVLQDCGR